ncbi:MAG: glucodextranase DOMON-like domain-containing protein [Thermoprotei archaeon]
MKSLVLKALAIFLVLYLVAPSTMVHSEAIISVTDPEGDDRGPGYYGYPGNEVFVPGVFDLTKFEVYVEDNDVVFKVYVKNLGGNPWSGPNGFCLQYVHIYVRTTAPLPVRMDTIGLNIMFRPEYAWHFALLLAPGWEESPTPFGQRAALYLPTEVVVQDTGFKVYAEPENNAIVARVSKDLIPDVENIASWTIVVALTSYDGFGPARVRPVSPTGGEWVINGTAYATPDKVKKIAQAITLGIEPRVMDLIVYSADYPNGITADEQYNWLDSYNVDLRLPAFIPGIILAPVTVTQTVTQTQTTTQTLTQTLTETLEKTITETQTKTQTIERTITTVSISPTTVTQTVTDWTTTGVIAVILLIIGVAIGYVIKRR